MFKDHKNVSVYWFCIGLSFLFSFYSQSSNHLRHLEVGPIQGQCVDGFWGSQCEHACSENCLEGVCERATGNCSPCQFPYQTGLNCASICPENCNSGCDQLGNCFDCTETSMWGAQCENTCNYRCPNSCDVADGSCLYPFNLATGMDIGLGVVINAFGQLAFNYWLTNKLGWRGIVFGQRASACGSFFAFQRRCGKCSRIYQ